jgi:hypothetical protein
MNAIRFNILRVIDIDECGSKTATGTVEVLNAIAYEDMLLLRTKAGLVSANTTDGTVTIFDPRTGNLMTHPIFCRQSIGRKLFLAVYPT